MRPLSSLGATADNLVSRNTDDMQELCKSQNVRIVTLPGALTQILQPLDVSIFAPFRRYYKKLLIRELLLLKDQKNQTVLKLTESEKRILAVRCSFDAPQQSTTTLTRENAFRTTGLFPLDLSKLIQNQVVRNDDQHPVFPNGRHMANPATSARVLVTSKKKRTREDAEEFVTSDKNENKYDEQQMLDRKRRRLDVISSNSTMPVAPIISIQNVKKIKNCFVITKSDLQDDYWTLTSQLERDGAGLVNNRGECDCLFLAVSDQLRLLNRPPISALQIRHYMCDYIIQNRQTYQAGFDSEIESLEQYIQKMRQYGYSGDGRLFPAICALYRVRVRVLMSGGKLFEDANPIYPVIELGYIGHIHYVSIQRV
ncbi:MAG: hypothetical protein EZS28_021543 [Streblomastix strix]|uniref:OTU domain-containing protein n=1 Tax=Streblomastix strix TaxID=222440 RepID=A0A5J4VKC6_9EUKA|nr:MAG: hypothetical protein EZS28_021543 [Streblomastix strix]